MLVKVRFGETQKYVKVAETEDGYDDFNTFLLKGWQYSPECLCKLTNCYT